MFYVLKVILALRKCLFHVYEIKEPGLSMVGSDDHGRVVLSCTVEIFV